MTAPADPSPPSDSDEPAPSDGVEPTHAFDSGPVNEPNDGDDLPAGTPIGRYRVDQRLGTGGFGTVYLAHDEELQRSVAIKVPRLDRFASPADARRFVEEARTIARLKHPAIIAIYDVGQMASGRPFVVLEYIDGITLGDLMIHTAPVPQAYAIQIVQRLSDALAYAHREGFIHRDLKPDNVLLDQSGEPHIADFGLALHEQQQRSRAGERAGTWSYMAPEQVRGDVHRLDGRTDIWAVGVLLYQMLTGRLPFGGDSEEQLSDEILHREPKPPRQIDIDILPELERICLRCCAKDPTNRYSTAADIGSELAQIDAARISAATPKAPSYAILLLTAIACLTLIAAPAVIWKSIVRRPPPAVTGSTKTQICDPYLTAWISNPDDPKRRNLSLQEPGTLPLQPRDQITIHLTLEPPGYAYLLWIDSTGEVLPLYPGTPGEWGRPATETQLDELELPPRESELGFEVSGPAGMEAIVVMTRKTPLPADIELRELLPELSPQPRHGPTSLVWFRNGRVMSKGSRRTLNFDVRRTDDRVIATQRLLVEALEPHFDVVDAVVFSNGGGEDADAAD